MERGAKRGCSALATLLRRGGSMGQNVVAARFMRAGVVYQHDDQLRFGKRFSRSGSFPRCALRGLSRNRVALPRFGGQGVCKCVSWGTYMNPELKTKYKRYDEAFKRSAVAHWLGSGKSGTQVAAEFGINGQNLQKWKAKFQELPAVQVAGTLEALQAENRRLQRELHRVSVQRDILKNPWV